jgi:hypothetical protein
VRIHRSLLTLTLVVVTLTASLSQPVNAGDSSQPTPKVACWDMRGETRLRIGRHPRECGLLRPRGGVSHYLIGVSWRKWTRDEARGRGASFRNWPKVRIRLYAPRRRCGSVFFSRVRVRLLGSDRVETYRLRNC